MEPATRTTHGKSKTTQGKFSLNVKVGPINATATEEQSLSLSYIDSDQWIKFVLNSNLGPSPSRLKLILKLEPLDDSEHAKNGMIHCMFLIQSYGIVIAARFQVNTNANMAKSGPSRPSIIQNTKVALANTFQLAFTSFARQCQLLHSVWYIIFDTIR